MKFHLFSLVAGSINNKKMSQVVVGKKNNKRV
jgi:hypothetical protein